MCAIGCYVHIPFCVKKCAYCDFNSYSGYSDAVMRRYIRALCRQIEEAQAPRADEVVDSVFFGGGTPTAIPAPDEAAILRRVVDRLSVEADAEITTEANPGSADVAGLSTLREAGFNRISFGVQSFDNALLMAIDRIHDGAEAIDAVAAARAAGFDNISIDLMFGLPRQTMEQWRQSVSQAIALGTEHLSMYALIVEEGTGFATLRRKGKLALPTDDLAADMYDYAIEAATAAGFEQYEVSNFARPGRQCRHNLHYWRGDDYYGFGAGAVSGRCGSRATGTMLPARFAEQIEAGEDGVEHREPLDAGERRSEAMMLGLRLTSEGVDVARFRARFGAEPAQFWPAEIARLSAYGLIDTAEQDRRIRLTERGLRLGSDVMAEFV